MAVVVVVAAAAAVVVVVLFPPHSSYALVLPGAVHPVIINSRTAAVAGSKRGGWRREGAGLDGKSPWLLVPEMCINYQMYVQCGLSCAMVCFT